MSDDAPGRLKTENTQPTTRDIRVSRGQLLRIGFWFTLMLCLVAAVLSLWSGPPDLKTSLRLSGLASRYTVLAAGVGLLAGGIVTALMLYWQPLGVIVQRLQAIIAWRELHTGDYIALALMAALGEEILFRGALQPLVGWMSAAIIFGLLHATSLAHIVLATLLGMGLSWLFQWSGSLWPPICAHFFVDLVTGLALAHALSLNTRSDSGD